MKPIFKYLCIPALITLPVSSAFADDPIKLPNERLADQNYDYTGKDIIIKWTKDGRPSEPAPIRNAHVTAQNITIEADYPESSNMLNKGIYSDSGNKTDITVTDTISITTYDDSVYTESNGKTNINGFKNLNITSRKGLAWWIMGTELISKAGITASSLLNLSMLHIHFGDGKFIIPALP